MLCDQKELENLQKPIGKQDILLDWGAGAGKWLIFAPHFLGVPDMTAIGIECERQIFEFCQTNLSLARKNKLTAHTCVIHANSQTFASFFPARIFLNYDGGSQKNLDTEKSRIHLRIMRIAFCSPSVDVIVSSKTSMDVFNRYFSKHVSKLCGSTWKCLFVPHANFGGSTYNVNIWFRLCPMKFCSPKVRIDNRIVELIAGLSQP